MSNRIIFMEISSCQKCPWCFAHTERKGSEANRTWITTFECLKMTTEYRKLEDKNLVIPDWCPLPEVNNDQYEDEEN